MRDHAGDAAWRYTFGNSPLRSTGKLLAIRSQSAPLRLVRRAIIIHLARGGLSLRAIAAEVQMSPHGVRPWIERFDRLGLDGLEDAPRSGRPPIYHEDQCSQIRRMLKEEHLAWQHPRTWLESDDPDFAGKGPGSSTSTRSRHRRARSSA
jgi:hypothetical protein